MAQGDSDDQIRVGTPERERAIALLNDAFSGGYLEIYEFENRSETVYGAKTRGELRKALEDLPVAGHLFLDTPAASVVLPAVSKPPAQPATAEFRADWETLRRKGIWQVPANILITGSMGTIDLDFVNAIFPGPMINLQLQVSTATVKLRVGADQDIRHADLDTTGWSNIKDKAGPPARAGGAVINLIGSISAMSTVKIRRA